MAEWTNLITVDRVKFLHARGIEDHGEGTIDPPRPGCLEGGLGNAWTAECYDERPQLVEGFVFAAHVYVYLEARQCFSNGNKRAAWTSMMDILNSIGLDIDCTDAEAKAICLDIAEGRTTVQGLLSWIVEHADDLDP